jgi:hypothetical protein
MVPYRHHQLAYAETVGVAQPRWREAVAVRRSNARSESRSHSHKRSGEIRAVNERCAHSGGVLHHVG